ncbi:unnamed protein product [Acanthoscelides obtectus]|uniref:Mos1 transposase HTH domain-containing protein n=1 Tax=Acanthoscelides obtectus TaxID=200917 RepID=A0A9P0PSR0_ACAOB|nr:unnamed protein product [Acanthoscelides obtectus]CAK1650045.1 hypothetical protein AOBTE_LOCUS16570 [Acanthoscelides obtectus]
MSDSHYKQRVVIQFLVKSDEKPSEIFRKLQVMYEDKRMSKTRLFKWAKRFKEGRESVKDDQREVAPVTSRIDANVNRLRTLLTADRRLSIRALSDKLNMNKEIVRQMLLENLNMRKVCAKTIPKVLTHEQKQIRKSRPTLYSPDIAPCDLFLFPKMKTHLKRTHHGGIEEVKAAVTKLRNWLTSEGYQDLVLFEVRGHDIWQLATITRQEKNACKTSFLNNAVIISCTKETGNGFSSDKKPEMIGYYIKCIQDKMTDYLTARSHPSYMPGDLFCGMPAVLGRDGVQSLAEIQISTPDSSIETVDWV